MTIQAELDLLQHGGGRQAPRDQADEPRSFTERGAGAWPSDWNPDALWPPCPAQAWSPSPQPPV